MRSALDLFLASNDLQSQEYDEQKTKELQKEVLAQRYAVTVHKKDYDDFMRLLVAIERITDFIYQKEKVFQNFTRDFLSLPATHSLITPHLSPPLSTFSSSLLSTLLHITQKLNTEFFQFLNSGENETSWNSDNFCKLLVAGLQLPNFFPAMREDEIYNKDSFNESLSKAKIFVPQAEKLWKVVALVLQLLPNFSKDAFPDLLLSIGEYSVHPKSTWTSPAILSSISAIKPPTTPSKVFGEYILQILSRVTKNQNHISSDGAAWCLRQVGYPDLTLHPKIVQFCLSLVENSDFKIKETGFATLSHVIKNVNAVELSHYQEPVYSLLSSCITSRELPILLPSLPLMIQLLQTCSFSSSVYDSLFSTFLLGLTQTAMPSVSSSYLSFLPQLILLAGIQTLKHASVLFQFSEGALHAENVANYELPYLLDNLQVLKSMVRICWPRVPVYKFQIFKAAVGGVVGRGEKCEESVVKLVSEILDLLKTCCNEEFKEFETLYEPLELLSPQITKKLNLA